MKLIAQQKMRRCIQPKCPGLTQPFKSLAKWSYKYNRGKEKHNVTLFFFPSAAIFAADRRVIRFTLGKKASQ